MMTVANELHSVWNARALVWVLTRREVASRHAGTAVGVLWPYLQPLLTVAAYYLVFDVVFRMRLGEGAPRMRWVPFWSWAPCRGWRSATRCSVA